MTVTEAALIQVLFRTVGPKQKTKMKARNSMAASHHLKVSSTRKKGVLIFSLVCNMEFSIISSYLVKVKVFLITLTRQS